MTRTSGRRRGRRGEWERGRSELPNAVLVPKKGLQAPIKNGDTVGSVEVTLESGETLRAPVLAASDMKRETIFQSIARAFGGGRS